jgi:hypothetical protein
VVPYRWGVAGPSLLWLLLNRLSLRFCTKPLVSELPPQHVVCRQAAGHLAGHNASCGDGHRSPPCGSAALRTNSAGTETLQLWDWLAATVEDMAGGDTAVADLAEARQLASAAASQSSAAALFGEVSSAWIASSVPQHLD